MGIALFYQSWRRGQRQHQFAVVVFSPLVGVPGAIVLLLALITPFAGPLLFIWLSRGGQLAKTIDQVIVVVLIVLVIALLLPETLEALGWMSVLLVLAGYLLPGVLEFLVRRAAETLHLASLAFALIGLMLHAMLDGAGLVGGEAGVGNSLGLAIVLHRFGEGLMLWLIVKPALGSRTAWLTLVGMAAATGVGYMFSERLLPLAGEQSVLILQAVIIGTIIHSLVHRGHATLHSH